ncbi:hypothetical protein HYFRA_00008397 [Hymenoscyphus fraxineus]|uniref:Uncharacterized protein n=1 Tax=Hymenoscyphus fraxineus TaxID=746836 RepID=A0A9N9KQB2_9HELO|nr:hypothetical protein HYFRA_00008397 [Hymenoscyphus fraxineus]
MLTAPSSDPESIGATPLTAQSSKAFVYTKSLGAFSARSPILPENTLAITTPCASAVENGKFFVKTPTKTNVGSRQ